MITIPRPTAHKELISKHETMRWESDIAILSVRKTKGEYIVRLEDKDSHRVTKSTYKTLPGALVAAETLRAYSL